MRKITVLLILFALILTLSGCEVPKEQFEAADYRFFDTVTVIKGYAHSKEEFDKLLEPSMELLWEYHRLLDIYNSYDGINNLRTVNEHAGEWVEVDHKLVVFLQYAKSVAEMTEGRVDVTLGAVLRIWHEARESATLPDENALREAINHTGFDKLEIEADRVRLTDAEASIDAGALGKGYAVEMAARLAPEGFLFNVGGNLRATGPKPDGSVWKLGIQNPDGGVLTSVSVNAGSVVTSGDYQRYFEVDGVRYCHIIDRDTLYPATKWRSVSIICFDSSVADALSTALFLMDAREGEALLEKFDTEALWIGADGEIYATPGLDDYLD